MNNFPPNDSSTVSESQEKSALFFIPSEDANIFPLSLILYLVPVIGFFPSLWTLYCRQGSREQLNVSRLSITLALTWLLGYILLGTGAVTGEFFSLRLLLLDSFLTSGYFLVSAWLIVRTVQGKSNHSAGFSRFANRITKKYLS
ncbi:MAG: hypothetical protein KME54_06390 [Tolypothrix brevis GSE-NOS-MK-07-07A]|jgi:hypothetical protein|nr:hypothetical protein [Tolypothrix brevis GSE-NOS-MK-07-07A]